MKPFPFLRLPRELRDQIYHEALFFDGQIILQKAGIRLEKATHDFTAKQDLDFANCPYWTPGNGAFLDAQLYRHTKEELPVVTLLRTCHQIHIEATSILYCQNHFTIFSWRPGATGASPHFGVVENIEGDALAIMQRSIKECNFAAVNHLTIHIHPWPFGIIPVPFLADVINDTAKMLLRLPNLHRLRIIIRVGSIRGRLDLQYQTSSDDSREHCNVVRRQEEESQSTEARVASWLQSRLKSPRQVDSRVEIRLMHQEIKEDRDALVLTNVLQSVARVGWSGK